MLIYKCHSSKEHMSKVLNCGCSFITILDIAAKIQTNAANVAAIEVCCRDAKNFEIAAAITVTDRLLNLAYVAFCNYVILS